MEENKNYIFMKKIQFLIFALLLNEIVFDANT